MSIQNLTDHFAIAEAIGAQGLIFHVGFGKELPKKDAQKKAVEAIRVALKAVPGRSYL